MSLPSPCGSECSTNTLVSCMSSLPTDPQSPQSPSHVISSVPCAPSSTPVCGVGTVGGCTDGVATYTVAPSVIETGWEVLGNAETYTIVPKRTESESLTSVASTRAISLGQTMSGTLSGLVNTVSEMLTGTGTSHTTISSGIMNTTSAEGGSSCQVSISGQSQGSHISSSMAVETPLVKTSDLSDHSDGSDETVTSDSHRCSEVEEK